MMETCIVLNADYTYLNTVNWKKAVCLMVKGKVEALKYTDRVITNFEKTIVMKIPIVMRLIKLIRTIYRTRVPFSKRNVLTRDKYKCVYCGRKSRYLTMDHVTPVSKGGKTNFENCVAACKECNNTKNDRLPSEAGMYPSRQPYAPTISEFLRIKMQTLGVYDVLKELGVY
jgi:5-methylcytosine-specific restriction endonuclease McrA